jgi:hypothetical protein
MSRGALGPETGDRLLPEPARPGGPSAEELIRYSAAHPWISCMLLDLHETRETERAVEAVRALIPPSAATAAWHRERLVQMMSAGYQRPLM